MKSPFPGMDPYMERRWRGVHKALIVHAAGELNARMGPGYVAEIEERLVIESPDVPPRDIYPDVYAARLPGATDEGADSGGVTTMPAISESIHVGAEEPRPQAFISVVDLAGGQAVTVIEFLSPTNKYAGPDRDQYQQKRRDVVAAGVNFVEVDLTRAGPRALPIEVARVPGVAEAAYLAFVRRGFGAGGFDVYPIPLRNPLPTLGIPLRPGDADVPLALQPLIDRIYREALFARRTDYAAPPRPALPSDDAAWAADLLEAAKGSA